MCKRNYTKTFVGILRRGEVVSTIVILIGRNWVGVKGIQLRHISDVWELVDDDDGGIAVKINPQHIHVDTCVVWLVIAVWEYK